MPTMYDSTNPWDIPADAEAVAGYDDGAYAWTPDRWQAWAHVPAGHITVLGNPDSLIADVETGDLTPASGAEWAVERINRGLPAVIYSNISTHDAIQAELEARGHRFGDHTWPDAGAYWWPADWPLNPAEPGTPHLYPAPGVVATQYASPPGSGGHYDISLTVAGFPAPATPPQPEPLPPSQSGKDTDVPLVIRQASNGAAVLSIGDKLVGIPDGDDLTSLQGAGVGVANVTDQFYSDVNTTFAAPTPTHNV